MTGEGAMKRLFREIGRSVIGVLALSILLCGIYPLIIWAVAQVFFTEKANGSLLTEENRVIGSALLAQGFTGRQYFRPRPSAAGEGYDARSSGGSNLGPLSRTLSETVKRRVDEYRKENGLAPDVGVPADAVTASGSGLDPHISPGNALIQAKRVARERGMTERAVLQKIGEHTEGRTLGIFGEPRVNVLTLNCALDGRL
jgi:potassium-transporting ATPase KdpC subunit